MSGVAACNGRDGVWAERRVPAVLSRGEGGAAARKTGAGHGGRTGFRHGAVRPHPHETGFREKDMTELEAIRRYWNTRAEGYSLKTVHDLCELSRKLRILVRLFENEFEAVFTFGIVFA